MTKTAESSNFSSQINALEQELEALYQQNSHKFAEQPLLQAELFLQFLSQKIKSFFSTMSDESQEAFMQYIRKELSLKNDSDIKNFLATAPAEMEKILQQTFEGSK
jgi:hypothetical protein